MDSFWFSINPDIIISPFDFVTVGHIFNTRTIGMVKELQALEDVGTGARVAIMANTGIENHSTKSYSYRDACRREPNLSGLPIKRR